MAANPDALVGKIFAGKFRIEKVLGGGGFATVYRARHKIIESHVVAIKILHGDVMTKGDLADRFSQEAVATAALKSPYSIRMLDFGHTDDGVPFLVTEFAEGESLDQKLIREKRFSSSDVTHITRGVLMALIEAHDLGIVHRDLKPGNVILGKPTRGERAQPKVLDFGIAKFTAEAQGLRTRSHTQAGLVLCTPDYAAPEIFVGEPQPSSDLYSLGIMMIEMLDGRRPYPGNTPEEIAAKHINRSLVPLGKYAERSPLAPIIRKAVTKPFADRYRRAEQMLADLDALAQRRASTDLPGMEDTRLRSVDRSEMGIGDSEDIDDSIVTLLDTAEAQNAGPATMRRAAQQTLEIATVEDGGADRHSFPPPPVDLQERFRQTAEDLDEMGVATTPEGFDLSETFANELAELTPSMIGRKAIKRLSPKQLRDRIAGDAFDAQAYRELADHYRIEGDQDALWCCTSALVALNAANEEERKTYEFGLGSLPAVPAAPFDDQVWSLLEDGSFDRDTAAFFEQIAGSLRSDIALVERGRVGLTSETQISDQQWQMAPVFRMAAHVLGVDTPEFHYAPNIKGAFPLNAFPNTVGVGEDALKGRASRSWFFVAGYVCSFFRNRLYLAVALKDSNALSTWVHAIANGVLATLQPEYYSEPTDARGQCVVALPRAQIKRLARTMQPVIRGGGQVEAKAWRRRSVRVGERVGLLLCGDVASAARRLDRGMSSVGGRRALRVLKDLLPYSVSLSYLSARRRIHVLAKVS